MKSVHDPSENGSATLEFAFTAIILFTLLFGVITICMAFYTYEVINEYARDASRYAIVHGNGCTAQPSGTSCSIGTGATANTALKAYLNNQIFPGINGNNLTVTTTYAQGPAPAQ